MRHLLIALLLIACSEQVKYEQTLVEVTGIEADASQCIYQVEAVVPYQPYITDKIRDDCGKQVGNRFIVRWIAKE